MFAQGRCRRKGEWGRKDGANHVVAEVQGMKLSGKDEAEGDRSGPRQDKRNDKVQ